MLSPQSTFGLRELVQIFSEGDLMAVSKKIKTFMKQGSWIRKMFEEGISLKEQFGAENIFDLSLGNPIMEPPPEFFQELHNIASDPSPNLHRYMPNAGYPETRNAVASQLNRETGAKFTSNHIVMTVGAGGALNVTMRTILDPGDEVIIFAPYFVEYLFYADNHSASCKIVPSDSKFLPNIDILENSFTPKTRIVIVNSPNNPTGVVYNSNLLSNISTIIRNKENEFGTEIFLVSDEPYRKILFDNLSYPQVFHHHNRSIIVTSHSKDLAIPGERIGFIAINPKCPEVNEMIEGLTFSNRTLGFVNAPALMQHIITKLQNVTIDVDAYQSKRDFLYKSLTKIGYSVIQPQGAFYMFPESPVNDDISFVAELRKYKVLVVPGQGFGSPGHFRISYCVSDATLEGSIQGFSAAFKNFS